MKHFHKLSFFICVLASALLTRAQVQDESRLALLIGNANYRSSPLTNPVNDVRLMETVLTEAGFKVIKAENASRRDMQRTIRDFGERLKQSGGVGLFYFAGHGIQVKGANYLVPVDADIRAEDEVAFDSIDAQSVLEKMETAKNRINLLILDACRDNPFAKNTRSGAAGLATMSAPSGSLVAYSTAPGSVASDGSGQNGLYTQHLASVMRMPDLPIEEVFKRVRANVRKDSSNQQTPWENTALEGNFYFKRSPPPPVVVATVTLSPTTITAPAPVQAAPNMMMVELAYWESIKNSNRPFELEAYIEQFPSGAFVGLAKARLREVARELKAAEESSARAAALAASKAAEEARLTRIATPSQPAVQSQIVAMATPSPNPAANTLKATLNFTSLVEGQSIGTMQLVDRIFNNKSELKVKVTEKTDSFVLMSTGDKIALNGNVLAARFGEQIVTLKSGNLWQLPLKIGDKGQADVRFGSLDGAIDWQVKAGANNEQKIVQANFHYRLNISMVSLAGRSGTWSADYVSNQLLPTATSFSQRPALNVTQQLFTTTLAP